MLEQPTGAQTRLIEGFECFRITAPPLVEEAWFSAGLQHVITERAREGGELFEWRIFDIHIGEPPADLFTIPATFRRVDRL